MAPEAMRHTPRTHSILRPRPQDLSSEESCTGSMTEINTKGCTNCTCSRSTQPTNPIKDSSKKKVAAGPVLANKNGVLYSMNGLHQKAKNSSQTPKQLQSISGFLPESLFLPHSMKNDFDAPSQKLPASHWPNNGGTKCNVHNELSCGKQKQKHKRNSMSGSRQGQDGCTMKNHDELFKPMIFENNQVAGGCWSIFNRTPFDLKSELSGDSSNSDFSNSNEKLGYTKGKVNMMAPNFDVKFGNVKLTDTPRGEPSFDSINVESSGSEMSGLHYDSNNSQEFNGTLSEPKVKLKHQLTSTTFVNSLIYQNTSTGPELFTSDSQTQTEVATETKSISTDKEVVPSREKSTYKETSSCSDKKLQTNIDSTPLQKAEKVLSKRKYLQHSMLAKENGREESVGSEVKLTKTPLKRVSFVDEEKQTQKKIIVSKNMTLRDLKSHINRNGSPKLSSAYSSPEVSNNDQPLLNDTSLNNQGSTQGRVFPKTILKTSSIYRQKTINSDDKPSEIITTPPTPVQIKCTNSRLRIKRQENNSSKEQIESKPQTPDWKSRRNLSPLSSNTTTTGKTTSVPAPNASTPSLTDEASTKPPSKFPYLKRKSQRVLIIPQTKNISANGSSPAVNSVVSSNGSSTLELERPKTYSLYNITDKTTVNHSKNSSYCTVSNNNVDTIIQSSEELGLNNRQESKVNVLESKEDDSKSLTLSPFDAADIINNSPTPECKNTAQAACTINEEPKEQEETTSVEENTVQESANTFKECKLPETYDSVQQINRENTCPILHVQSKTQQRGTKPEISSKYLRQGTYNQQHKKPCKSSSSPDALNRLAKTNHLIGSNKVTKTLKVKQPSASDCGYDSGGLVYINHNEHNEKNINPCYAHHTDPHKRKSRFSYIERGRPEVRFPRPNPNMMTPAESELMIEEHYQQLTALKQHKQVNNLPTRHVCGEKPYDPAGSNLSTHVYEAEQAFQPYTPPAIPIAPKHGNIRHTKTCLHSTSNNNCYPCPHNQNMRANHNSYCNKFEPGIIEPTFLKPASAGSPIKYPETYTEAPTPISKNSSKKKEINISYTRSIGSSSSSFLSADSLTSL